ncbi:MAG: hypothetical protein FI718_09515 [SAR202 cluster bacterium]|nr:hypothetical protein [Chloroflexota bacterium]MQG40206.1 hypothetical protein [SAR202 cluster bacterium]
MFKRFNMRKRVCNKCKTTNKSSAKICSKCQSLLLNNTKTNSSYINRNLGYDQQTCISCGQSNSLYGKLCPSCESKSEKPPHY